MLEEPIMKILYKAKNNGLHAFDYNSAESEPIWMKSGTLRAKCWGLAAGPGRFWARIRDSLRGSRNFVFFWSCK